MGSSLEVLFCGLDGLGIRLELYQRRMMVRVRRREALTRESLWLRRLRCLNPGVMWFWGGPPFQKNRPGLRKQGLRVCNLSEVEKLRKASATARVTPEARSTVSVKVCGRKLRLLPMRC